MCLILQIKGFIKMHRIERVTNETSDKFFDKNCFNQCNGHSALFEPLSDVTVQHTNML